MQDPGSSLRDGRSARPTLLTSAASFSAPTRVISGLRDLVDDYDVFLLDQFGVLHNGGALMGVAARWTLANRGKRLVVLSNTSGRRHVVERKLPTQGFDAAWLAGVVTSGELARLGPRAGAASAACCSAGTAARPKTTRSSTARAPRSPAASTTPSCSSRRADTIVTSAAARVRTRARESSDLARTSPACAAARARVPMLVCNSDLVALSPEGRRWTMPGALAQRYRGFGGPPGAL